MESRAHIARPCYHTTRPPSTVPPSPPPRGGVGSLNRRIVFLNATLGCPRHPDQRCRPVDANRPPHLRAEVSSSAPPARLRLWRETHTHTSRRGCRDSGGRVS